MAIKRINPDDTWPFCQNDLIGGKRRGKHEEIKPQYKLTSYTFQAIVYAHKLRENQKYCWASTKGGSPRYSYEMIGFLNNLTKSDFKEAIKIYQNEKQNKKQNKKQKMKP